MGNRKQKAPVLPSYTEVDLGSAVVQRRAGDSDVLWWTQEQATVGLAVTDRTLRNWHEIGLPHRPGPHGRPIYPAEDCRVWAECYRAKVDQAARRGRAGPKRLSLLEALNWREIQRTSENGLTEPRMDWFVIVPLDWGSWDRERLLRLAVEGTVADDEWLSEDEEALVRARQARYQGHDRIDVGWPDPPAADAA